MYALHLQHPAVSLHPRGLRGHLVPPNPAAPPRRRRSPPSPLLAATAAAAGSRFPYASRASAAENPDPNPQQDEPRPKAGFWSKWTAESAEMRARVAKLGLAAFDAVTYTTFFVLAFLGYEKSTGKNPAANCWG